MQNPALRSMSREDRRILYARARATMMAQKATLKRLAKSGVSVGEAAQYFRREQK